MLLNADIKAGNAARQWQASGCGKPCIFMLCEKKQWIYNHGRPQGGKTGVCSPRSLVQNQKRLENLKTTVQFRLISLILAIAVYLPVWYTAEEVSSPFWWHEVVSLQFRLLMFGITPADVGCKACEWIVRSLFFIA